MTIDGVDIRTLNVGELRSQVRALARAAARGQSTMFGGRSLWSAKSRDCSMPRWRRTFDMADSRWLLRPWRGRWSLVAQASMEEIVESAKAANIHDFIMASSNRLKLEHSHAATAVDDRWLTDCLLANCRAFPLDSTHGSALAAVRCASRRSPARVHE